MNKNKLYRKIAPAVAAFLCFSSVPAFSAVSCKPELDEYKVKDSVNMELSRIESGDHINLSIDMKDSLISTNEISSADNIEIFSVDGGFGSPDAESVTINSSGSDTLEYTIDFKDIVYSGVGSGIGFKVRYKDLNLVSDRVYVTVDELSQIEGEPENPNVYTDDTQPYIEIGRSEIAEPIKPNEEFTVTLNIKNRGSAELKRPSLTMSLPDSINALEGMGNISIPNIKAGGSSSLTIRLKAADYIMYASEEIDISLSYSYDTSSGLSSGSYSDRIFIPMEASSKASSPLVQITRDSFPEAIKPDSEFDLTVRVRNIGDVKITSPILSLTLPEELMLAEDNSALTLEDLEPEQEISRTVKLKSAKYMTQAQQKIEAGLKFSYMSAGQNTGGSEDSTLIIPTVANDVEGGSPLLYIATEVPENTLSEGQTFTAKAVVSNVGETAIQAATVTFEASEGIIITKGSASQNIGELKAGETKEILLSGKIGENPAASTQTINGELKYKYESGRQSQQGSETIKFVVSTNTDTSSDKSSTPNLIVSSYNYGGVPIANGESFMFDVVFENTSKTLPVDNIVMTVETGEGISIKSASNTYYYDALAAGGKQGQSIEMQILPTAETGSAELNISFKYEYVDGGERNSVSSSQMVAVPAYKPDRLEINLEPIPPAQTGIEQTVTLNYVNKGKGELSNVKAEIIGDVNTLTAVQNLGNFESGKSGSIYFVVTPETAGDLEFTIKVSYEDPNMEEKVLEFPCVMSVEEYIQEDVMTDEPVPEETGGSHKKLIVGGIAAVIVIAGGAVVIIRRKRKKKSAETVKIDWEAEDENKGSL